MAKKEGVRKLFDNIAPDYDRLNHILSLNIDKGWRRKAVREIIDEAKPLKVLDVACGTGDFTIEIARKASDGSEVIGVDISEGMMTVGREKIRKAGVSAELYVADCEALPYADNTFDRISVGFGVRNFEHLELGLEEMYRVLLPGGSFIQVLAEEDHLLGLKNIIYPELHHKEKLTTPDVPGFRLVESRKLQFTFTVEEEQVQNLLSMTPHVYRIGKTGAENLRKTEKLTDTASCVLNLYKPNQE